MFCVTYNYSAYPMVRQARAMVQDGTLGAVRQVQVEYIQGHLAARTEADDDPAAAWRFAEELTGPSLVLGDIGTHAHHLASYISGQALVEVAAEVGSVLPGRKVDDFAHLLLRYDGGARGSMWVTNSAAGGEHGLAIKVFGEHGGIEWHQEDPNHLLYRRIGGFPEIMTRGRPGLSAAAQRATRVALGHPEGYFEAFANLYSDAAAAIVAQAHRRSRRIRCWTSRRSRMARAASNSSRPRSNRTAMAAAGPTAASTFAPRDRRCRWNA